MLDLLLLSILSGFPKPQGIILPSFLFSVFINIMHSILLHTKLLVFANNILNYLCGIKYNVDYILPQTADHNCLVSWGKPLNLQFHIAKYQINQSILYCDFVQPLLAHAGDNEYWKYKTQITEIFIVPTRLYNYRKIRCVQGSGCSKKLIHIEFLIKKKNHLKTQ